MIGDPSPNPLRPTLSLSEHRTSKPVTGAPPSFSGCEKRTAMRPSLGPAPACGANASATTFRGADGGTCTDGGSGSETSLLARLASLWPRSFDASTMHTYRKPYGSSPTVIGDFGPDSLIEKLTRSVQVTMYPKIGKPPSRSDSANSMLIRPSLGPSSECGGSAVAVGRPGGREGSCFADSGIGTATRLLGSLGSPRPIAFLRPDGARIPEVCGHAGHGDRRSEPDRFGGGCAVRDATHVKTGDWRAAVARGG